MRLWTKQRFGYIAAATALLLLAATGGHAQTVSFAPSATSIDHRYEGGFPFIVGGGVAAFDCDGDGLPELVFAGGAATAALYRNVSKPGGELAFRLAPAAALALTEIVGAYPADFDGDGHTDLALLRVGENVLLRGRGDCGFERANAQWGFTGGTAWSTGFTATWERGAPWPTIAIANYIDRVRPDSTEGACHNNMLMRPKADGRGFAAPLALSPGHCALSILFSDWNASGAADLRISNDRQYYRDGEEQLWRIRPGALPRRYSRGEGWQRLNIWGMGIASRDITGDGRPEYFLTSMADNKLRTLAADAGSAPTFADIALARGATAHRPTSGPDQARPSTGWHSAFADVNNDGHDDIFIVKGNVAAMADFATHDPNVLLLGTADGRFTDTALDADVASPHSGRGGAVVDLNGDGRLDIVVVNRQAPVEIWRNTGPAGNWLSVALRQDGGNRDAIGAWIEVEVGKSRHTREVTIGGGHASGVSAPQHFGLGDVAEARVRVRWPGSDVWGDWHRVDANRRVTMVRPPR
ncbi:MAG: CRTAC1 family protein [Alphaproteobacteria bacterium]|nr:CRTAC1 family protein [Alphaproteobacteria bacterium]